MDARKHLHASTLLLFGSWLVMSLPAATAESGERPSPWIIPNPLTADHPAADLVPCASPATYADRDGFTERAHLIVSGLAQEDLSKWRRGYFTGGDPGKYLPPAAMAKLLLDPNDVMARAFLNDARSPTEHYHFAAVNWSRLIPIFGAALSAETMATFAAKAATTSAYLDGKGTENHKTMWYTSSLVLPYFTDFERFGNAPKAEVAIRMKEWLRSYVKTIYQVGQGEWDSSTYVMFDVNGMLNIYDFSPDPECRLLARAALDWIATAYALKYTDGVYCAPNQRGHAGGPVQTISDQTGWLWWGASRPIDASIAGNFRYAMHPVLSSWRPNQVICNLAHRQVNVLPVDFRNSKPNYWFGQGIPAVANCWQETVHIDQSFTLGCLWSGHGGQTTRLQLVAPTTNGALTVTGGSPIGRNDGDGSIQRWKYGDGNGLYDRSAQIGSALVVLSDLPDDEPLAYAFTTLPVAPVEHHGWWIMRLGEAWVGIRPLGGPGSPSVADHDPGKKPGTDQPILRIPGHRVGFILQASTTATHATLDAFSAALAACTVDDSQIASDLVLNYTALDGSQVTFAYQPDLPSAATTINGKLVSLEDWAVYDGPYVHQRAGVLEVNDGSDGFCIDFTGDLPVYRPWSGSTP
jgi:hypothetical protein